MQMSFQAASLYSIMRTAAPPQLTGQLHVVRAAAVGVCVSAGVSAHQGPVSEGHHLVLPWLGHDSTVGDV